MNRLRYFSFALVLCGILLVVGTGSFSATDTDRDVSVEVTDDGSALLGVTDKSPVTVTQGTTGTRTLLTLDNRFEQEIDVEVDGSLVAQETVTISSGTTEDAALTVDCDGASAGTHDVTLSITATGDDVTVDTEETVEVTCEAPTTTAPTTTAAGG